MFRPSLLLAASFGFTDVVLGAFVAHGLKKQLSAEYLTVFQIGAHYQLIHALVPSGATLFVTRLDGRLVSAAGGPSTLGILLFSGNPYLLALSGIGRLDIVTPFGGVFFLADRLCLGLAAWRLGNT